MCREMKGLTHVLKDDSGCRVESAIVEKSCPLDSVLFICSNAKRKTFLFCDKKLDNIDSAFFSILQNLKIFKNIF